MIEKIFHTIGQGIITLSVAVASIFGYHAPTDNVGATIPVVVAVFQTSLQASITASATAMTLVNGTNSAGNALSGYICFNIDEGTAIEEFVCGTASSTSITSMIRGIDPVDGDLEVTALKKAHRRGASVKVTNYPSLAIVSRLLNGNETFPNKISYTSHPTFSSDTEIIDKKYADDLAIAGSPDASTTVKGIVEEATTSEINAGTGAGGTSARLFVNPSDLSTSNYATQLPSSGEKSALVGDNTDIAVGSGNKYVTQTGLQHNAEKYIADTSGSSTAYVATLSPAPTSYTDGMVVYVKIVSANTTTTPTLAVNGLTARTIVKTSGIALAVGDIGANMLCTFIYDLSNTRWILQSPVANAPVVTGTNPAKLYTDVVTAGTSVSNATTTVYTQTVTANTFIANSRMSLFVSGNVSGNNSGNVPGVITITLGGTTIFTTSFVTANVSKDFQLNLEILFGATAGTADINSLLFTKTSGGTEATATTVQRAKATATLTSNQTFAVVFSNATGSETIIYYGSSAIIN